MLTSRKPVLETIGGELDSGFQRIGECVLELLRQYNGIATTGLSIARPWVFQNRGCPRTDRIDIATDSRTCLEVKSGANVKEYQRLKDLRASSTKDMSMILPVLLLD